MTRITIDDRLIAELRSASGPIELCGSDGRTIGRFEPVLADYGCPFSEEELNRRRSLLSGGGKSTAEVLRELGLGS